MLLGIAVVVVLILLAVALLPTRKRDAEVRHSLYQPSAPSQRTFEFNLREQQLREEASAIADEYKRRADEVWLDEVKVKATGLLGTPKRIPAKS